MRSSIKAAASGSLAAFVTMANQKYIHGIVLICAAVLTSSCGGGSSSTGGQGTGSVSFSATTISFSAAGPFAQAPATQTITGTVTGVTSGTVYVAIQTNDPNGFFSLTNVTAAGNSAQVGVI